MPLILRKVAPKDHVLQSGTVVDSLVKDISNTSSQPYLQVIASFSLLIMETLQVRHSS